MEYKEWIEELYRRADLVKFIAKYTALNKKGGSYWGCCPFHHEKTPSFSVSAEKQLYHCFGCGESGNIISFTKKIESVDFPQALQILGKEFSMPPLPAQRRSDGEDPAVLAKKRERLYGLMREAARHYHTNLSLPQAKPANEYIARRELPDQMVKRFGLGYSVDSKAVIRLLEQKGYTKHEMKEAGLVAQRADDWYDVFYGRLIFPIINNLGEVVSFGGRMLENKPDFAKYRNGSQTLIFNKSNMLYAINLLKKRMRTAPIEYVIMAEGYMDVIALHRAGFDTAVASMGTALTQSQARLLKNYCDKIYISYDGDGAGQKATLRGLDILAEAGFSVKVISLPDGLDPDDVIKTKGAEFYKSLMASALTLPAFKLKTLAKKYNLSVADEKANYAVEAIKIIKSLKNPIEQEEYLKIVHNDTGYSMSALLRQAEITAIEDAPPEQAANPQSEDEGRESEAKRFILASMLAGREYVTAEDISDCLTDEFSRAIYAFLRGKADGGLAPLFTLLPDDEHDKLNKLINYRFMDGDNAEKFEQCVRLLRIDAMENNLKAIYEAYDGADDPELKKRLLDSYREASERLTTYKSGTQEE